MPLAVVAELIDRTARNEPSGMFSMVMFMPSCSPGLAVSRAHSALVTLPMGGGLGMVQLAVASDLSPFGLAVTEAISSQRPGSVAVSILRTSSSGSASPSMLSVAESPGW